MQKNQPLFFKKRLSADQYNGTPNATFLRDMGMINSEPVCEIEIEGAPWIVRYSEIETQEEAAARMKLDWTAKIEAAKKEISGDKKTKAAIAAALGISTTTLRKRMKWLEEVTPPSTSPASKPQCA